METGHDSEVHIACRYGNYQILAIDGPGASDDRIGLASGVRKPVGPGEYVDTKPGVSGGPVRS